MSLVPLPPRWKQRRLARAARKRPDVMMVGLRNVVGVQGGIETHVRHLIEELAEHDVQVEVIARSPYSRDTPTRLNDKVSITSIWAPHSAIGETFFHTLVSVLYAAISRPRVLHIHAIGPGLMTPLARLLGLKVVITHHGQDYNRERWNAFGRLALRTGERLSARFANERIVISRPLATQLTEAYRRTFWFIPNGVTPGRPTQTHAVLDTLKLAPRRYILNVGRLVPEKRQRDLIKAFQALDDVGDLKLVFVGKADYDSDYSREIRALGEKDERIVFAGFQQGVALSELFSHAALFALPSSHEGLAIAALEAMSYGLPLLISDIPPNLALNLPADSYARTGSVDAWVEGLSRQMRSGRLDWSEALSEYAWRDVASKTLEVYRRVW